MPKLEILGHSTVYRNPHPNRFSEYVAFPAILALPDDSLLCACRHGTARESDDGVVNVHRSTDGGATWQPAGPLPEPAGAAEGYHVPGVFGLTREGDVLAWVRILSAVREASSLLVTRSSDVGDTWSPFSSVDAAPFDRVGCGGNLVTLADGTVVSPGEWGDEGKGDRMPDWSSLLTRSTDGGRTWERWRRVHEPKGGRYFFDMRITLLEDGRLLAVYWTHDMQNDQGVNVHSAWSSDGGETWTEPQDTGFWGQVTDVSGLRSGRVIAVTNHRREPMGIRAALSEDGGGHFAEADHVELWGVEPATVRSAPVLAKRRDQVEDALDAYHFFTFGTPSVTQLSDGTIAVAYYVTEEHVTYVRCCRMREID